MPDQKKQKSVATGRKVGNVAGCTQQQQQQQQHFMTQDVFVSVKLLPLLDS